MTLDLYQSKSTAWIERQYYRLVAAGFCSNVAVIMVTALVSWTIVEQTRRPDLGALAYAAFSGPTFLFAALSGALADAYDRRRLQIVAQIFIASSMAGLLLFYLSGMHQPALMLLVLFVLGAAYTLRAPAWQVSVIDLITDQQKQASAFSLNAALYGLSRIVGVVAFGILTVLTVPAIILIALVFTMPMLLMLQATPAWQAQQNLSFDFRFVKNATAHFVEALYDSHQRSVMLRVLVASFLISPAIALLPAVAISVKGGGPLFFSLIFCCFGVGAFGALPLASRLRRARSIPRLISDGLWLTAVGMICLSVLGIPLLSLLGALGTGIASTLVFSSTTILLQDGISSRARGMAFAIYQIANHGGTVIGSIFWGMLAQQMGTQASLAMASGGAVLAAIAASRFLANPQDRSKPTC